MSESGEHKLANGVRVLWSGKAVKRRFGDAIGFTDKSVVLFDGAVVSGDFCGAGTLGVTNHPTYNLAAADETVNLGDFQISWTGKVDAGTAVRMVAFSDGSEVLLDDNGELVRLTFRGHGLLVIRRNMPAKASVSDEGSGGHLYPSLTHRPLRRPALV